MFRLPLQPIALALLVLSAGPVRAWQNNLICTANVSTPTQVRSTGVTELVGDIVVVCTGGAALAAGAPIPRVNLTIYTNAPITSRILDPATGASEALLLINEPGAGVWMPPAVSGYGSSAPQILCPAPLTGCAESVAYVGPYAVPVLPGVTIPPPVQNAPNLFQGVVTGPSQLTFFGVPSAGGFLSGGIGNSEVFRITNLRVNAAAVSPVPFSGVGSIFAVVTSDGFPIASPPLTVAYVFPGFQSPNFIANFPQCAPGAVCPIALLRFSERFAAAAKIRLTRNSTGFPGPQNIPGMVYAGSESGFYAPAAGNTVMQSAGLADFGTRLKAVLQVPPGVRIWVSTGTAWSSPAPYFNATLTATENGPFTGVPATLVLNNRPLAEIPVVNGIATAVWEVLYADPAFIDSFDFPVYAMYTAGTPTSPWIVRGSLAPTPDEGAFPPDGWLAKGPNYPIPRFFRPPVILMPTDLMLAPGQFVSLPLTLSVPAGPGGVSITFASADPSVATVTPSTFLFGGSTSPDRRPPLVTGVQFGRTTITTSAPGYDVGTVAANVLVIMTFSPTALALNTSQRQARPLLTLNAPAPPGGLTINLTSSNPAVVTAPASVFIPADSLSVAVPVTATGVGTALIRANISPSVPDAILAVAVDR